MEQNLVRESHLPAAEYYSENFYLRGVTNLGDEGVSINIPQWLLPQILSPNLVPYENATRDVNVGTHAVIAQTFTLNGLDRNGNPITVTLTFSQEYGVPQFFLPNGVTGQLFEELFIDGKCQGQCRNGYPAQFVAAQGGHILVKEGVASELNASPHLFMGVFTHTQTNGNFVKITWFGNVNDMSTSFWESESVSPILYVDMESIGSKGFTTISPSAPYRKIIAASIVKYSTGASENGRIIVRPTFGHKLSDLDDVDGTATSVTYTDKFLKLESSGIWKRVDSDKVMTKQLPNIDVLASSFSLVSGFYEATIEHEDILSTHSVEVIPEKAYKSITDAAKFADETDSFDGSVKIYCEVAPTADFQVTLNLIPVV